MSRDLGDLGEQASGEETGTLILTLIAAGIALVVVVVELAAFILER